MTGPEHDPEAEVKRLLAEHEDEIGEEYRRQSAELDPNRQDGPHHIAGSIDELKKRYPDVLGNQEA